MLRELTVVNFRNIARADVRPDTGINFIFGDNGAGKSSLLEAIDFLSRGRTFRSRLSRALIREGCQAVVVSALLDNGQRVGFRRKKANPAQTSARTEIRVNGKKAASQAEVAAMLPAVVFHSGHFQPHRSESRHWCRVLDWGTFHVKPAFHPAWVRYQRALRQRNTLLRQASGARGAEQWERQMVEQAGILDACRQDYADKIVEAVDKIAQAQNVPLHVRYERGWPEGTAYEKILATSAEGDRQAGYTRYGPHRALLRFFWDGVVASERASRGQQKAIAAMLMVVQVSLFGKLCGRKCLVMVDDWAAEFDRARRKWLFEELLRTGQQVFITSTDKTVLSAPLETRAKMFHMKHGSLFSAG